LQEHGIVVRTAEFKNAWVIFPAVILVLVGGAIAILSGDGRLSKGSRLRAILDNSLNVLLRIAGYVIALLILQYFAGQRAMLGW